MAHALRSNTFAVQQSASYEQINRLQSEAIREQARRVGMTLSILEAGCGQRWTLDLTGVDYKLTGIDLDPAALDLRINKARDLDIAIVGDICTADLPAASFDVVFNAFVLEHIEQADHALTNLIKWLKPGGLLLLRIPERSSARGYLTRVLPHWVHVAYYRLLGSKQAGQPGFAPYPTYYHPAIALANLPKFFNEHDVECLGIYGDGFRREPGGPLMSGVLRTTAALSFGRLTADYNDLLYIARKSVQEPPGVGPNLHR